MAAGQPPRILEPHEVAASCPVRKAINGRGVRLQNPQGLSVACMEQAPNLAKGRMSVIPENRMMAVDYHEPAVPLMRGFRS